MLVTRINIGFDTLQGDKFNMIANKLYANHEVPEWVSKTQTFKDAKEKGLILKKDIETKISQTKKKFEKEDTKKIVEKPKATKKTYSRKPKTTENKEANL